MVSDRHGQGHPSRPTEVLILVLMEYGLGRLLNGVRRHTRKVLILVLMEYGLGPPFNLNKPMGTWS